MPPETRAPGGNRAAQAIVHVGSLNTLRDSKAPIGLQAQWLLARWQTPPDMLATVAFIVFANGGAG